MDATPKIVLYIALLLYSASAVAQKKLTPVAEPTPIKAVLKYSSDGSLSSAFYITPKQWQDLISSVASVDVTIPDKAFKNDTDNIKVKDKIFSKANSTNKFTFNGTDSLPQKGKIVYDIMCNDLDAKGQLSFIYDSKGGDNKPSSLNKQEEGPACKNCNKQGCDSCHEIPTVIYTINACMPSCKAVCSNRWRPYGAMIVKQNELVAFRIKNLNPFRYSYQINNTEVSLNMDDEDNFKGLVNKINPLTASSGTSNSADAQPDTDSTSKANNEKIKTDAKALDTIKATMKPIEGILEAKKSDFVSKNSNLITKNKLENISLFDRDRTFIEENVPKSTMSTTLQSFLEIKKLQTTVDSLHNMADSIKHNLDSLNRIEIAISKAMLDSALTKAKKGIADVKADYNRFNDYVNVLKLESCIDNDAVNAFLLQSQKDIDTLITHYGVGDTLSQLLKNTLKQYASKVGADSSKYAQQYETSIKNVEIDYTKTLNNFIKELNKYRNASLEMATFPYQPKAKNIDLIQYDLIVTDNNTNKANTYSYNVFVRNGFKIDFASGIFLTGLKDKLFSTLDIPMSDTTLQISGADTTPVINTSSKKKIIVEDNGKLDFMVGALMNLTWRWSEMFSVGASFGLGFSTQTNFQFIAGPAFTFGKFYRVSLHTGVALGKVKELDSAYNTTDLYSLPSGNPPTIDKFGYSWFVGVTYNFLKVKKEKATTDN